MNRVFKLIILIGLLIFMIIMFFTLQNKLLVSFFNYSSLVVGSSSMNPELTIGDVIIIKKYEDYDVEDIVTYNVDNQYLVTHRIIKKEGTNFVTKGDNNNTIDSEIVRLENIEGKVIYKTKILKYLNKYKIPIIILTLVILIFI